MRQILSVYIMVALLMILVFLSVGQIASAQELRDPMQPPALALRKFRAAKWAVQAKPAKPQATKPKAKPLQLTSILFSVERKIAIIDNQMLALGDSIRGAKLVRLTRESARLVRRGKIIDLSLEGKLTAIRKRAVKSDL